MRKQDSNWIEQTKQIFPSLFAQIHPFNFGCGEGWKPIIHDLCEKLLVLEAEWRISIKVVQIKEKFGTLRFYWEVDALASYPESLWDQISQLVREAELKSSQTCEHCGTIGELRGGGWIRTLCDQCESEYRKERP